MRMSMARQVMYLGRIHVVVVVRSASLRTALVTWLDANKRVRVVRSVGRATELDGHTVDCDLVVASALEGPRDLRALGRRFGRRAGLVALSLGADAVPAGWSPLGPGASIDALLEHAVPHPQRAIGRSAAILSALCVAAAAAGLSVLYVPDGSVSFERAALAYAARWPDAGVWWHIWGAGGPYLASPAWPLLKLASLTGGGPEAFLLLSAVAGAAFAVSFLVLMIHLGARRGALLLALLAIVPPALWVWPRAGDVTSLVGLTGVVLALAGAQIGRSRFVTSALATAAGSFGGILWVMASAVLVVAGGARARRIRASASGAFLGALASAAVTVPPLLSRGIDGLRPALARPLIVSDLVPVVVPAALMAVALARGRMRTAVGTVALAVIVAANALAFVVPVAGPDVPRIDANGAMGRLAVHPAKALSYAALEPDLSTTGSDVSGDLVLGNEPRESSSARLDWLGVDRAAVPDRSAAIVFNERDWSVIDRDRLLLSAPGVRPILTAGTTPTILVVADDAEARTFGEALIRIGATSDRMISVRSRQQLDELDRDTLRTFTMVAVYGQPWKDVAKAETVLDDYLALSGFVFMDAEGHDGPQPLVHRSQTVVADPADTRSSGDANLIVANGFGGRVVGIDPFIYRGDPNWEQASLTVGNKRVIQYGRTQVAGDVGISAHVVWSGVDLPGRAAKGDRPAVDQLATVLSWMISAADVMATGGYGTPNGDVLDSDLATSTFLGPTHWRVELKAALTGVLFKERYDGQWRAYQVEISPVTQHEISRTPLKGLRPTTQGYMYVTLPPNARVVDFVFERHPLESATRAVSGVAGFIILGVWFLGRRRR